MTCRAGQTNSTESKDVYVTLFCSPEEGQRRLLDDTIHQIQLTGGREDRAETTISTKDEVKPIRRLSPFRPPGLARGREWS